MSKTASVTERFRRKKEIEKMIRKTYKNSTIGRKAALKKVIEEFKEDLSKSLSVNSAYLIEQELARYEARYKKEYMRPVIKPTDNLNMPFCITHREITNEELENMKETIEDILEDSFMIFDYNMDIHAQNFTQFQQK